MNFNFSYIITICYKNRRMGLRSTPIFFRVGKKNLPTLRIHASSLQTFCREPVSTLRMTARVTLILPESKNKKCPTGAKSIPFPMGTNFYFILVEASSQNPTLIEPSLLIPDLQKSPEMQHRSFQ